MRGQRGFFDVDDRLKRLSDLGDQLEAFRAAVDFEMFRPDLDAALAYSDGAQGGRPPFDPVISGDEQSLGRTRRVLDQRSPVVHAFSRIWIIRSYPRRADDLAVSGKTDESRRHWAFVRAL
jgi:hypothetical protein